MPSTTTATRAAICGVFALVLAAGSADARQRRLTAAGAVQAGDAWRPLPADTAPGRAGLPVAIDFDLVKQVAARGGILTLALPQGLSVRVVADWVDSSAAQVMVAGALLDADGEASLTVVGDALSGRIVANGRLFMVRRLPNSDTHIVTEIDRQSLPREGAPISPDIRADRTASRAPATAGDTNAFVDLMVLYTPTARAQIGGTSAMVAELTGAVNHANLALANAGVVHRFRLVHNQEVAYSETGDMGTTLARLRNPADGFMDNVLGLRNQHKADVVSLLSADDDACGVGYLMGPAFVNNTFESWAYNVTWWECANANLTLAHEIGHNMGLHHDRPNANSLPAFEYAYGYAVNGLARDVMAYDDCSLGCGRRAIYSTPNFSFPGTGVAAGTATEDNARALNGTSTAVANFRQGCSYSLASTATSIAAGGDTASVAVTATAGCTWTANSNDLSMLTITGGASGSGNGVVTFAAAPNLTTRVRSGTLGIAGIPFGVLQYARSAADFDNDAKSDITIYRPSSGTWYMLTSRSNFTGGAGYVWGVNTDIPVTGDFDGDGRNDITVFRPGSGHWFVLRASSNYTTSLTYQWGTAGDIPVPGDYDGDNVSDLAIYRPSNGTWYIARSTTGYTAAFAYAWGISGDVPVPGDYDGDGRTDVAVFRGSTGHWFIRKSSTNFTTSDTYQWGTNADTAVPADYDGDARTDLAIYRKGSGTWFVLTSASGFTAGAGYTWGVSTDVPVPGDYDGDGRADVAVYRPSSGHWFILTSTTSYTGSATYQWGATGDIPVLRRP